MSDVSIAATVSRPAEPIRPDERINLVDALRGFALLGILSVNMQFFADTPVAAYVEPDAWPGWYDRAARWLVRFAAEGKFYSLFSMLFGFGMSIQMSRAAARGGRFAGMYSRRLLVLLGIGIAHVLFIWDGDILIWYALIGFVLLLFRNRRPRTLLIWAVVLICLPILIVGSFGALAEIARLTPDGAAELRNLAVEQHDDALRAHREAIEAYGSGTYLDVMAQRLRDWVSFAVKICYTLLPSILAMFLIGLAAGKLGVFAAPERHGRLIRRVLIWGGAVGITGSATYAVLMNRPAGMDLTPLAVGIMAVWALSAPALALFYAVAATRMWQARSDGGVLRVLCPLGRMALTNYLMQSLVCTLIFNGYGLGLFRKVGPAAGLALTLGIWLAQIPLSYFWLRNFRFGPAEWLWRTLTYGRAQPMRVAPTHARNAD